MWLSCSHIDLIALQGDRERITVFGPGAGAASSGLLAVMPRSRSMVRRVIAMSGSPLADWASIDDKFRAMNTRDAIQLKKNRLEFWLKILPHI